ncbi:hypothetical protein GY45DRAFT_1324881 [Cubamyces sp. BRFM 1775]|nr:hypothetical protein GY45DRAFT_1324881 [Cubamyces sp. BRFM 1775]
MAGLKHVLKVVRFFGRYDHRRRRAKPSDAPTQTIHSSTGIDALPTELLIDILDDVYASIWLLPPAAGHKLRQWLNLLHVCGRWRAILVSLPRFWVNIPLAQRPELVQHLLSKVTRGWLGIYGDSQSLTPKTCAVLFPYRSYIYAVELSVQSLHLESSPIRELLSLELPRLGQLSLLLPKVDDETLGTLFQICHVFTEVWHIVLRCSPESPSHTHSQPALELEGRLTRLFPGTIWLDRLALVHATDWGLLPISYWPLLMTIAMRELLVWDQYHSVAAALSRVSSLEITDADILCYITSAEVFLDVQEGIFSRLSSEDRSPIALLIFTWSYLRWSVTLSVQDSECVLLVCSNPPAHRIKFRIQLAAETGASRSRMFPLVIEDMFKVLRCHKITEITIDGDPRQAPAALWERFFQQLNALEHLKLIGNGTWIAAWQVLLRRDPLGWTRKSLYCRTLKSVRVEYRLRPEENHPASPDVDTVEVLRGMLQVRRAEGHALEEFAWAVQSSRHADYHEARTRFLQRLGPFVERLSYDDLDQTRSLEAPSTVDMGAL